MAGFGPATASTGVEIPVLRDCPQGSRIGHLHGWINTKALSGEARCGLRVLGDKESNSHQHKQSVTQRAGTRGPKHAPTPLLATRAPRTVWAEENLLKTQRPQVREENIFNNQQHKKYSEEET